MLYHHNPNVDVDVWRLLRSSFQNVHKSQHVFGKKWGVGLTLPTSPVGNELGYLMGKPDLL